MNNRMKTQRQGFSLQGKSDQEVTQRYAQELLKLKTLNQFGRHSERFLGYPNTSIMNCCRRELERRGLPIPAVNPGNAGATLGGAEVSEEKEQAMPEYDDLAQLWHEFVLLGPPRETDAFEPMDFVEWLDTAPDNPYGIGAVERFLAEKERREGTAVATPGRFPPPEPASDDERPSGER